MELYTPRGHQCPSFYPLCKGFLSFFSTSTIINYDDHGYVDDMITAGTLQDLKIQLRKRVVFWIVGGSTRGVRSTSTSKSVRNHITSSFLGCGREYSGEFSSTSTSTYVRSQRTAAFWHVPSQPGWDACIPYAMHHTNTTYHIGSGCTHVHRVAKYVTVYDATRAARPPQLNHKSPSN